jgi:hypothetical protein
MFFLLLILILFPFLETLDVLPYPFKITQDNTIYAKNRLEIVSESVPCI